MSTPKTRVPVPSRRFVMALAWVVGLVVLALMIYLTAAVDATRDRAEASQQDRAAIRAELAEQEAARLVQEAKSQALARQVQRLGGRPVVDPGDPDVDLPELLQGPRGPRGPGCVEEIGVERCRGGEGDRGARGEQGGPGAPGDPGAPGQAGEDGAPGTTGPQGEPGPGGPQGPAGPQGPQGERGPAGADGRGVADLQCGEDGRWTVTYTDGTTADGGVCRETGVVIP